MPNGRCALHGGKSLVSWASPRRTHGLYSRDWLAQSVATADLLRRAGFAVEMPAEHAVAHALLRRLGPRGLLRRFPPAEALGTSPPPRSACELRALAFPVTAAQLEIAWERALKRLRRAGKLRAVLGL